MVVVFWKKELSNVFCGGSKDGCIYGGIGSMFNLLLWFVYLCNYLSLNRVTAMCSSTSHLPCLIM